MVRTTAMGRKRWEGVANVALLVVGAVLLAPMLWPLVGLAYALTWLAYWRLAQGPERPGLVLPGGLALPYLPLHPVRVWNVTGALVTTAWRLGSSPLPRLLGHWAWRKLLRRRAGPGAQGDRVVRGISYAKHLALDVYPAGVDATPARAHVRAAGSTVAPHPVLIYLHGGAWGSGSKELDEPVAETLSAKSWIVVVPNLSHHPKRVGEMLQNVRDVYEWTLSNIHQYGGNVDAIFFMGHSSGGCVCVCVCVG
jgi:acetyl esterase/lipase